MRKPNDITLKQAIDKLLNHYKLRGKFDETGIVAMWPEIMGTAVANRTKQIYVHQRKLFVRIESSVVKNELLIAQRKGPSKPHVIARLQALLERLGLEELKERFFVPTTGRVSQSELKESSI